MKKRSKAYIKFEVWEDGRYKGEQGENCLHRTDKVPLDDGMETLLEIWKKI